MKKQSATAARLAADDLEDHGEPADVVWVRLERGGFTVEQVRGDWFPELNPSSVFAFGGTGRSAVDMHVAAACLFE